EGVPIFPEEYSMERLAHERQTLRDKFNGDYDYVHFFLNESQSPEDAIFKPDWKRLFKFKQSNPTLSLDHPQNYLLIEHKVYDGKVQGDVNAGVLEKRMLINPADAKKKKRSQHVIMVVGYYTELDFIYLLDVWAESCLYGDFADGIFKKSK